MDYVISYMNMHRITHILYIVTAVLMVCGSCIEDGYTTAPSDQPVYSVDTLRLGVVYTEQRTTTSRFTVHNPYSKSLNISEISISGANPEIFRINVDGMGGTEFRDIEIRANDSIYVMVDAYLPENGAAEPQEVNAMLDFSVNGRTSSVVLSAYGQDIERLRAVTIHSDMQFTAKKPYQIFDSLVVAPGATLTLEPGVRMLFHDQARLVVHGALIAEGTPQQPILLTGDRTGEVLPDVSFDIMSRQWDGIEITETASPCRMAYAEVSNTTYGISVFGCGQGEPLLTAINCKMRNAEYSCLAALDASVHLAGCEVAEAGVALAYLVGGQHKFDLCTFANNYLFSAIQSGAITIVEPAEYGIDAPLARLLATNCIFAGLGQPLTSPDLSEQEIYFKRCLFGWPGEDDDNFAECIWDADPLFYTVRNEYLFDYRLQADSPAIGAANPALSELPIADDYYGIPRALDLGAYAYVATENQE